MLRLILALWWILAACWFLTAFLNAQAPFPPPANNLSPKPPSRQANNVSLPGFGIGNKADKAADWPRQVEGFGLDVARAQQDAYLQAQIQLTAWLHRRGLTHFQPTLDYVKTHLLAGPGQEGPGIQLDNLGMAKTWILPLKSPNWSELTHLDRLAAQHMAKELQQVRRQERMGLLGRILAAVVLLLGGVGAYIRLDDWTKGRYTRYWRLGGATLLGLAGLCWWWLR